MSEFALLREHMSRNNIAVRLRPLGVEQVAVDTVSQSHHPARKAVLERLSQSWSNFRLQSRVSNEVDKDTILETKYLPDKALTVLAVEALCI